MTDSRPLTAGMLQFLAELAKDPLRNATEAYARAYPNCKRVAAGPASARLMADPRIQAAVAKMDAETRERNRLSVDRLAQHLAELVEANPNDLTEWRIGACRHCWGVGFKRQRKQSELDADLDRYRKTPEGKADPMCVFFDYAGGVGYRRNREPNPDCPECEGEGEGFEIIKDTRTVPPAAARLFAGVKRTKDGLQILTRSQDKALELAMRSLGMLTEKTGDDETDVPPSTSVTYAEQDASKATE